jgi:hypothetical protein
MIPKMLEMAKDGKTMVQFAAEIGVCKDTLGEWRAKHPEFSASYKEARLLAESFWTERLAKATIDPDYKGNANLLKFYISACFGWSEKTHVQTELTVKGTLADAIKNSDVK